jgi:hypothetical protein
MRSSLGPCRLPARSDRPPTFGSHNRSRFDRGCLVSRNAETAFAGAATCAGRGAQRNSPPSSCGLWLVKNPIGGGLGSVKVRLRSKNVGRAAASPALKVARNPWTRIVTSVGEQPGPGVGPSPSVTVVSPTRITVKLGSALATSVADEDGLVESGDNGPAQLAASKTTRNGAEREHVSTSAPTSWRRRRFLK